MSDHEGEPDGCPFCGGDMEHISCYNCHGHGGWHDCGEDCCPCLDKEEITVDCQECHGHGWYAACSELPHTEEQMSTYRAKMIPLGNAARHP